MRRDVEFETWRDRELDRRLRDEADDRVEQLAPAEAFPDEYSAADETIEGKRGREATVVEGVLAQNCAGWRSPPRAVELFEAMQADEPSRRQLAVATAFVKGAHVNDILMATLQGAFTWRQLASMLYTLKMEKTELSPHLNRWADTRPGN